MFYISYFLELFLGKIILAILIYFFSLFFIEWVKIEFVMEFKCLNCLLFLIVLFPEAAAVCAVGKFST